MKHFALTAAILGTTLCVAVTLGATVAEAATIVGNESYEVSWQGIPASDNGDQYQVYFGQANGNKEEYSVFNGLDGRSHSVRLNNLKPCTEYSWSLKSLKSGRSNWVIRDRRFTTGGVCDAAKVFRSAGASVVKEITHVSSTAMSEKMGSATVSWSPVGGATEYRVYYRSAAEAAYGHSVRVPSNGSTLTINSLKAGVTYYYRVAALVDNKEVWFAEKVLQNANSTTPVLGIYSSTPQKNGVQANMGGTDVSMTKDAYGYEGVLGNSSDGMVQNRATNRMQNRECVANGKAMVSIRVPAGVDAARVHVFYGNRGNYQHALRNLEGTVREVEINHLNSCASYAYQVAVVASDGRVHMQGEHMLQVTQ